MKPYLQKHNLTKLDVFISAFLSFTFTAAPQYISSGSFRFSGRAVVEFVLYMIILLFLAAGGRRLLLMGGCGEGSRGRILAFAEKLLSRRSAVILIALLMFLFWLPVLIALYPGTAIKPAVSVCVRVLFGPIGRNRRYPAKVFGRPPPGSGHTDHGRDDDPACQCHR